MGLLHRSRDDSYTNINKINYSYSPSTNAFRLNKYNDPNNSINDPNIINIMVDPDSFNINNQNESLEHTNNKWFVNLSDVAIPHEVSTLLQYGDRFSLPTHSNKKTAIHEFIKDIESNIYLQKSNKQTMIRNIAIPYFHKFLKNTPTLNLTDTKLIHMHKVTEQFCKNNKEIIFSKADKGNITVAMDRTYYISKVEELLKDKNTYTVIRKNPTKIIENKLNNILKFWLQKEYITKQQYFKFRASDALLPKAYGLPKIHKEHIPIRLIVSSINTALYPLASFLQDVIADSIENASSYIANSFDLYMLSGKQVLETDVLISFDVISLFTNVPLDLAIDSISNRWSFIKHNTRIPKNDFIQAIEFVLSSTYFTFNNIIYKQTFGTPMGSPLSPIIADTVMQDLETKCLKRSNCQLTFYFRYVDDIVMATHPNHINVIFKTFNDYHQRLKFTIEQEDDRSLSFLDLLLRRLDNKIHIDWFHKKTFSGRFLSYFSSHPVCHKVGMIYSLIDRAFLLSHPSYHQKNVEMIVNLLLENGYPLNLIFEKINSRLKTLIYNKRISNNARENNNRTQTDNENTRKIVALPYIKNITERVAGSIDRTKYIVGYRILNNLGKYVRAQKDQNKWLCNNNVVYKINCNDCSASYVGQTKRQLSTRIKEHVNNFKSSSAKPTVLTQHMLDLSHSFDWKNIQILDAESNYYKRSVSEMLHIKEQLNGINAQTDTELLDESYFEILDVLSKK